MTRPVPTLMMLAAVLASGSGYAAMPGFVAREAGDED